MLDRMLLAAGGEEKLYVEDVFSTYLYTGNGSTQTITNGIDLSGKGGMVWIKQRASASSHALFDTARAATNYLQSNSTSGTTTFANSLTSFNSDGFSLGSFSIVNQSTQPLVSWTFREAPKFFDVVTWTGNGTFKRVLNHSLGVAPGFIVVKRTDTTSKWWTWHRGGSGAFKNGYLNDTPAFNESGYVSQGNIISGENPALVFDVFNASAVGYPDDDLNVSGATYVAYLFAHDATADGIIQCGSFTADSGGLASVNLGWEPQWVMVKSSDAAGSWQMMDTMRGWYNDSANPNDARLWANLTNVEQTTSQLGNPTATGFDIAGQGASQTYVYIAIRRGPMKTPTVGTSVFSPTTYTGTGTTGNIITLGVTPDLMIGTNRDGGYGNTVFDRLRGNGQSMLETNTTGSETTDTTNYPLFDVMNGYRNRATGAYFNNTNTLYIRWAFRRAPGFFDVVCYTGTGVAGATFNHNLGVVPELLIYKRRNGGASWIVQSNKLASVTNNYMTLNSTSGPDTAANWLLAPTTTTFGFNNNESPVNASNGTYVAYLFASCPGVSKVGSYTGNGSSQTINCGFSNGARFFLVKRTNASGDWWVYDSARGIVAAADPALRLNSIAAEVTSADAVDPTSTGIIVNQEATCNINVNGATYIYLAIA